MPPRRVSEASPIQVYLGPEEQERLAHLATQLHTTKSDVLRRGLLVLERELLDPTTHPALQLIGLAAAEGPNVVPADAARDHDRVLANDEERRSPSPDPAPSRVRGRRAR